MNQVPDKENYQDSSAHQQVYTLSLAEPLIYVEKIGSNWYYSVETINNLDKLYHQVFPFGTRIFKQILPLNLQNKRFLGIKLWQITGIFIILFIYFFLY